MKIYILGYHAPYEEYGNFENVGIFSAIQKAKDWKAKLEEKYPHQFNYNDGYWEITEEILDNEEF